MLSREIMTTPVVTIRATTPINNAADLLVRHGFTGAPVTDEDDHLIGIVTEADLLRHAVPTDPRHTTTHHTTHGHRVPHLVADVMTTPVESLTPGSDASQVAALMLDHKIRCVPIVDGYSVVGIITRRDLLRHSIVTDDSALANRIRKDLSSFGDLDRWDVRVQAGVAIIEDHWDRASDREIAEKLALAIPGVVSATARFVTSDPF